MDMDANDIMPSDANGNDIKVGDVLHMPGDNDSSLTVDGFVVLPTYKSREYDRSCVVVRPELWEVVRRGAGKAETLASKRLEKLMAQLGVETYGEARTAINELKQHQTTENAKRWKDRAEYLSHKLADVAAEAERLRRERDQEVIECDAAEEACDSLREEVVRMKARQLPEGVEWPRFADGGQVLLGDHVHHEDVGGFTAYKVGFYVDGCVVVEDADGNAVVSPDGVFDRPKTADSWEKLEEDAGVDTYCIYFNNVDASCLNCIKRDKYPCVTCQQAVQMDIVRRAKELAGVK